MEFLNINQTVQSAIRIARGVAREYGYNYDWVHGINSYNTIPRPEKLLIYFSNGNDIHYAEVIFDEEEIFEAYDYIYASNPNQDWDEGRRRTCRWQKNAGHSFQTNQQSLIMNKQAKDFLNNINDFSTFYNKWSDE